MQLSHDDLNLRRNPFGEPPVEDMASLIVCEHLDTLEDSVNEAMHTPAARCIVQFMGQCGRGKSSHMRALNARFPQAPRLYFAAHEPHPTLPNLRGTPLLFLDETQRLSWWTRQRLWRSHTTLVIATHTDHRQEWMARSQRFIHMPIGGLDRARLRAIIEARITWATRDPHQPPGIDIDDDILDALIERHDDDLRAMLSTLYELVQCTPRPGPVTWPTELDLSHIEPSGHVPLNHTRVTFTQASPHKAYKNTSND